MARDVMEAPAPAPASVPYSYKSLLLRLVMMRNLEAKVILAWVIWSILRILQSILGPWRRRSRHWFVQYVAMAAYYLPTVIAFYTTNAVFSSDSPFKISLSIGCLYLLLSCARGSVTMTALTVGDSSPLRVQSWRLLPWLLYFAWLQWSFIWFDHHKLNLSDCYSLVLCIGPVLYVLLSKPRAATLDYETKLFADLMSLAPSTWLDVHAGSLCVGCKCPFMPTANMLDEHSIYFSYVLRYCTGGRGPQDNCLAYLFCRLLARRYFGLPCAEDGNPPVRDLILTELLLKDYKRAFAIVEVQLALLHDYFFTNFHSDILSGLTSLKQAMRLVLWMTLYIFAGSGIGFLLSGGYKLRGRSVLVVVFAITLPASFLYMIILLPNSPILPRYWHPIRNLFLDLSEAPPIDKSSELHYWRENLSQYSVMEDYDRRSFKKKVAAWCKVHVLSQASYSFIKHNPSEEEEVSVPERLKRFLADTISDIYGPPNHAVGTRLPAAGLDNQDSRDLGDVSWTINLDNLTHTILIWHIATCYCHMSPEAVEVEAKENPEIATTLSQSQELEEVSNGNRDREAAKILSQYCAYLVAFAPELLPQHPLTVKYVLQMVLKQTRDELQVGQTRMSMEAKRRKIDELLLRLPADVSSMTTFQKGVHLGQQLEKARSSYRWKTMAVFWAEMILYVAAASSSDKSIAAAHVEQLAQGGEFVTHLWALLCNAGIVIKPGTTEYTFSAMLTSRYREV